MIVDAFINFFVGLLLPLVNALPSLPATTLPTLPPFIAEYVRGFLLIFTPGVVLALGWRVIAYFLPGGAG